MVKCRFVTKKGGHLDDSLNYSYQSPAESFVSTEGVYGVEGMDPKHRQPCVLVSSVVATRKRFTHPCKISIDLQSRSKHTQRSQRRIFQLLPWRIK